MPPERTSTNGPPDQKRKFEKRIEDAVALATKLKSLLSNSCPNPNSAPAFAGEEPSLIQDVLRQIERLHAYCQQHHHELLAKHQRHRHGKVVPLIMLYIPGISGDPEIDAVATGLWNICVRLLREDAIQGGQDGQEREGEEREGGQLVARKKVGLGEKLRKKLYLHAKVLAFFLLGVARPRENGGYGVVVRLMKLGLKVLRDCVDAGESKLASLVVQVVADYKTWLHDAAQKLPEEEVVECRCLEVQYFIMRTAMAWIENRLDVAEHMYTQAMQLHHFLTAEYAEKLADVLYEIGKSLSSKNDFVTAVKWLERANEIINGPGLERLSREGIELRLAILQALITTLLGTGVPEDFEKAKQLVDFIESENGNKFVVLLLKLELLQKKPAEIFDAEAYADVLQHIIRNFASSESGFKLVMHHIRKLHTKSPGAACTVLDDFMLMLSKMDKRGWMEKGVVMRIWMITNQRDSVDTIETVKGVFSQFSFPLGPEAAVAAQALLWKKLESNFTQGQYELAESWCELALSPVFKNCGPVNTSKLERKLLLCALKRNSMDTAIAIIQRMSPQSWKEPMTAYLAFKVAMRVEDRELAEKCLETVSQASDHVDYLGACIAESQKSGDIPIAISALRKLQERYEYTQPNPVHLPALFRCTIRLLNLLIDRSEGDKAAIVEELCKEFEAVVAAIEKQKQDDAPGCKLFTMDELEWFSRNAYNLALKNTTIWDLRCTVRMLTACVKIINHFPQDIPSRTELSLKALFCHFVAASALVSLARTQDNIEKQLQDYVDLRKHVLAFDSELPEYLAQLDEQSRDDMLWKNATLLAFDFEAAIALKQWDDLGGIVQRAVPCKNIVAFQAMADSLLRARTPAQVLYSIMRKLVNEIWVLEAFDAVKLAKYTRCLFQATLPLDDELAMKLLDEACSKARALRESQACWPEEELEWMATTAFNHAADFYVARELERAKEWATKAINLAHWCGDGGRLEEILQSKYLRLRFDSDGVDME